MGTPRARTVLLASTAGVLLCAIARQSSRWDGEVSQRAHEEGSSSEDIGAREWSKLLPPTFVVSARSTAEGIGIRPYPGIDEHLKTGGLSAHAREPRDATWAPAMEAAFGRRISAEELAKYGLENLRVTEISCRRVTCRLAYEYPKSVEDLLAADGLPRDTSPLALIEEQTGPPAPLNLGWSREEFDRDGQHLVRFVAVFGFDEKSYDPNRYDEWVESEVERTHHWFGRMPRTWSPPQRPDIADAAEQPGR